MSRWFFLLCMSTVVLVVSASAFTALNHPLLINRIEGRVYDPNRNPVWNAEVELSNDAGSFIAHTKTDSGGRFTFSGITSGRFSIRVLDLRSNLMEQTQEVELANLTRISSDTVYVDFYLRYDKRRSETTTVSSPDSIFVQDVPQKAKELYEKGVEDLAKNTDKAFAEFEEAIKIFPAYFDALSITGKEYVNRKDYEKGYPYLLKAIDINPRSSSSYYSLGYAFLQLNQIPAAVAAAKATVVINSSCVDCQLLYGTVLRTNGSYTDAEKALLKAKSLAKKPVAEIHWQLALLYNKLKRNREAADELEAYLKIQPDSPDKKKVQDLIAKLRTSK